MRNSDNQIGHTINRILLVSPEQNELGRRNHSRIFVWPVGEGVIDSIIFQNQRPADDFIDAASRAIALSGLRDTSGSDMIRSVNNHSFAGGMMQQYLATTGWLATDNGDVYDLAIEVQIEGENLATAQLTKVPANRTDDSFENPVILAVDTEMLRYTPEPGSFDETTASTTDTGQGESGGGAEEPVADPNRAEMSARAPQARDQGGEVRGRAAGRPGRLKNPDFDMRLKRNRTNGSETSGRADQGGK